MWITNRRTNDGVSHPGDIAHHTPGLYHPDDDKFDILKQPPDSSSRHVVPGIPHPFVSMPHVRDDTPKTVAPPKKRLGTATTFLPVVCGPFQSCTSAQTNTTLHRTLNLTQTLWEARGRRRQSSDSITFLWCRSHCYHNPYRVCHFAR